MLGIVQSKAGISRLLANLVATHWQEHPGVEKPFKAAAAPEPAATRPLFLQVETEVDAKNKAFLEKNGAELTRLIGESGLPSRMAAWGAFPPEGERSTLYVYWFMKDGPETLLTAELRLPDVPEYAEFADLIVSEQKDIVLPMTGQRVKPSRAERGDYHYVRVEYMLDMRNLSEFSARLDAGLVPFAARTGWALGDTFLGLTGQEGAIVQIWRAPGDVRDAAKAEKAWHDAAKEIERAPWRSIVRDTKHRILEPASFDKQAPDDPADPSWSEKAMANDNNFNLDAIGARGLVIYDKDESGAPRYHYVLESELRKHPVPDPGELLKELAKIPAPAIAFGKDQVLLNYDKLKGLNESQIKNPEGAKDEGVPETGAVVVVEDGKFFVAARAQWRKMIPGAEGDAGVLVSRGAVVAAIPPNQIPSGTYCVLVNMEGLLF